MPPRAPVHTVVTVNRRWRWVLVAVLVSASVLVLWRALGAPDDAPARPITADTLPPPVRPEDVEPRPPRTDELTSDWWDLLGGDQPFDAERYRLLNDLRRSDLDPPQAAAAAAVAREVVVAAWQGGDRARFPSYFAPPTHDQPGPCRDVTIRSASPIRYPTARGVAARVAVTFTGDCAPAVPTPGADGTFESPWVVYLYVVDDGSGFEPVHPASP